MKLIIDTREKTPWDLSIYGISSSIICLSTGDYTVEGLEDILIIERKSSVSELAGNLGKNKKRFENELGRMESFRFRYIICEFTQSSILRFPKDSKIPKYLKKKMKVSGKYLSSEIIKLCEKYGIEPIFCDGRLEAEKKASEIIKEVVKVVKEEE